MTSPRCCCDEPFRSKESGFQSLIIAPGLAANQKDACMFVVKTLTAEPIYKAFGTSTAARRWAENDAYSKHRAEQCQIYRSIGGLNSIQAIAAVKMGRAERLLTVHRRNDSE